MGLYLRGAYNWGKGYFRGFYGIKKREEKKVSIKEKVLSKDRRDLLLAD